MKPFRFPLEAVATVRKRTEGETLEAYARALLSQQQALKRLEAAQRELDTVWDQLRRELGRGCPAANMIRLRGHAEALDNGRRRHEATFQQAGRAVQQSLRRMLAARQQREVVDKLRNRQHRHHDRDEAKETQKFLDELATQRSTSALAGRTTTDPFT